jgi:hypothetical protein
MWHSGPRILFPSLPDMPNQRIHGFEGTESKYARYLEDTVHSLQSRVKELEDEVWHLRSSTRTPSSQQSSPPEPKRKKTELSNFLSRVPKDEKEWSDTRIRRGFHDRAELVKTFALLTHMNPLACFLHSPPKDRASMIQMLDDYGAFLNELATRKNYATQVSHFSTLLFCCLALVALELDTPLTKVDEIMKTCLSQQYGNCTASGKYLSRLRTAARWAVQRVDELYKVGLKHRAWEIFLMCTSRLVDLPSAAS